MRRPMARCRRCQSSVIVQRFSDESGYGVRWTCLGCADEHEQFESAPIPAPDEVRRLFAAEPQLRGRPRKVS